MHTICILSAGYSPDEAFRYIYLHKIVCIRRRIFLEFKMLLNADNLSTYTYSKMLWNRFRAGGKSSSLLHPRAKIKKIRNMKSEKSILISFRSAHRSAANVRRKNNRKSSVTLSGKFIEVFKRRWDVFFCISRVLVACLL